MPKIVLDNPIQAGGIVLDNPIGDSASTLQLGSIPASAQSFDDNLAIPLVNGAGDETVSLGGVALTPDSQSALEISFESWVRLHLLSGALRYGVAYELLVSGSNGSASTNITTTPELDHIAQTIAGWDGVGGTPNDLFDNDSNVDNGHQLLHTFLLGDGTVGADGKCIITVLPATVGYWVCNNDGWSSPRADENFSQLDTDGPLAVAANANVTFQAMRGVSADLNIAATAGDAASALVAHEVDLNIAADAGDSYVSLAGKAAELDVSAQVNDLLVGVRARDGELLIGATIADALGVETPDSEDTFAALMAAGVIFDAEVITPPGDEESLPAGRAHVF